MTSRLLEAKSGKKVILLGNEAIVRGSLESGIGFSSTYPGTPVSEIGDTFSEIAKEAGIYFEYSTNEKVALEAAAGASLSEVKSLVSFKNFGLNVASDSVFPLAYTGVKAGMVIVVGDDPNCWSSGQSEQDSRCYARLAHLPMLEPSDAQECKTFTKLAFEISERFKTPVFLRLTTRVAHERGLVTLDKIVKGKTSGTFIKDIKYKNFPPHIMKTHEEIHDKLEEIEKFSEGKDVNKIIYPNKESKLGIVTSGSAFCYVMEAFDDLGIKLPVLKIGLTYPLPENLFKKFIKNLNEILVVEELDPILEDSVYKLAKEFNPKVKIFGKNGYIPKAGECTEEIVISALCRLTGKKYKLNFKTHRKKFRKIKIARRLPVLCPGCPHRATFYAARAVAGKDAVFGGDIGCYIMGIYPPLETQDFIFSMGASQGISHGIKKVSKQKIVSFIGDSTFFHAGIPGLINMVYNKSNPLVIVLDNRITAMTGHQPNPGMGVTGMGEQTKEIVIEDIVKACGVENVKVIDPYNLKEMMEAIKEFLNKDKVSVIVSKRQCRLLTVRKMRKEGMKIPKFEIDQTKCTRCGECVYNFGCPAIMKMKDGSFFIDKNLCWGCAVCVQICPAKAIGASR